MIRPRLFGPEGGVVSRRRLIGGLAAGALAGCGRFDLASWVARPRYDVDHRFTVSMEELAPPVTPRIRAGEPWSMLVISDLHSWQEVLTTFDEVEAYLDTEPVDLLCCLGDLADAGYAREFEAASIGLESLGLPLLTAFGNHDSWNEGWAVYRDIFGPSAYEVRVAGSVIVVLDTAGATLGGLQRPWFEERLELAAGAEHLFVLTHYPLWTGRLPLGDQLGNHQESYDILDLIRTFGVDAHISGHTHRWASTELEGVRLTTVSSLWENAADRTALRVDVEGPSVTYRRIDLG